MDYNVIGDSTDRILLVSKAGANRYRFYKICDGGRHIITLKSIDNQYIAAVTGKILVFKKPHPSTLHGEVMRQNSRSMYLGVQFNPNRVLANMLEFIETI